MTVLVNDWRDQKMCFDGYETMETTFLMNGTRLWFNPKKVLDIKADSENDPIQHIQDAIDLLKSYWLQGETAPSNIEEYAITKMTAFTVHQVNAQEIVRHAFSLFWNQEKADQKMDDFWAWLDEE